jgi:hypothetical protein
MLWGGIYCCHEILDYHQYYLNLSSVLTTKVDNWEKEYDAKKDYNLTSLNATNFEVLCPQLGYRTKMYFLASFITFWI